MELPAFYQCKRDLFCEGLKQTPFEFVPAQGSFFQQVHYGQLSSESDFDLAVRMTKEIGVASIPVSVFYAAKNDPKILRFCFAKEDGLLEQALDLSSFHLNSFQKKQFLHGLLTKNPTANEYL